jgi:hypothetical protein
MHARRSHPITVLGVINIRDSAVRTLFHDPNANLKGGALRELEAGTTSADSGSITRSQSHNPDFKRFIRWYSE